MQTANLKVLEATYATVRGRLIAYREQLMRPHYTISYRDLLELERRAMDVERAAMVVKYTKEGSLDG